MNKILVAFCPNCYTDASKHNKVLYEGIFLICHSCGYGWYYNIQIINSPHNNVPDQREYHSKSAPLSTLNSKEDNNYKPKHHNTPISKRNIKTKTNKEASSYPLKNHNYNKKPNISDIKINSTYTPSTDNKKSTTKNLTHNVTIDSYKNSKGTVTYNNNIYYKQSPYINKESKKISIPLEINHTDPISTTPVTTKLISSPSSLKPNIQPLSEGNTNHNKNILNKSASTITPKSDSSNYKSSSQQIVFNTHKTPLNSSNNLTIDLANLPNKQSLNNPHEVAKTEQPITTKNNSDPILPNTNTALPFVSGVTPREKNSQKKENTGNNNSNLINTELLKNNTPITTKAVENKKEEINLHANQATPFISPITPKISEKNAPQENKLNNERESKNLAKESPITADLHSTVDKPTPQEIPSKPHNETLYEQPLNYSPNTRAPNFRDKITNNDLKLALNNFNMSLSSKETLGLSPSNLLKIEEQSQYNLKSFKENKPVKEPLLLNIKDSTHHIKNYINYLFKGTYKIITRPDLLLKTCAYIFIIGGIISFLWHSNQIKHKKIKETSIHNPSFNSHLNNSSSDNVTFDNNVDINGLTYSETSGSKPAFNEPKISITKEETNNKIIAFQKNANQDKPSYMRNENNISHKKVNIFEPTFIENLTYKAKDTWLNIKHLQQNAFNYIKVYQKNFNILGEHNDQLVSNTTLYNHNTTNSYLVKSLEVVFLEKTGKVLGKRIILTNQIVNSNSAIDLNLKINNPPLGVNNIYIYINDKRKI